MLELLIGSIAGCVLGALMTMVNNHAKELNYTQDIATLREENALAAKDHAERAANLSANIVVLENELKLQQRIDIEVRKATHE